MNAHHKTGQQPGSVSTPPARSEELAARFEVEVSLVVDQLRRTARRYVHQAADADDLVQETLMRAWRAYGTFEADSNFRAWVHRIMVNTWISSFRTAQRRPSELLVADHIEDGLPGSASPAERPALPSEAAPEIREAIQSLPELQRVVVYYAYIEGRRHKDIAELTGAPVGTVMSRLHRARHHLRASLGDFASERGYGAA
ncbi:sigma-70 family RNA polymerase sigma factor [Mycolicibacterium mengxianglii]|uniref:sigma-70 family RNA polymerase sigma factor n=1 Tax=Mycolicibacterium mengxianglii TaxID=2736649 RepID=UPI0018D1C940|nr:sigma-70 family RNA polymerase sigma factor [Mycolicibacterium mengxianglii]